MNRSVLRGIVLITLAVAAIAVLVLSSKGKPKSATHPPNNDPWVLVNYDPNAKYGTYLGNGFMATRVNGDGVGQQCFLAGLYKNEKLTASPNWAEMRLYDGKTQFRVDKESRYKQTLDMKTGILTTEATWRAGGKSLKGKIEVIVSRATPHVALVRATLTPDFAGELRYELGPKTPYAPDALSGYDSNRGLALVVQSTVDSLRDHAVSDAIRTANGRSFELASWTLLAWAGQELTASDAWKSAISNPGKFVSDHKAAMAKLWERDIIIDGPVKDQQALRACRFYLLQSVREGSQCSIPPMGLSSEGYQGHIFWDADIWMFPALVLQYPELAKSIVDYRYNTLPGAFANAKADGFQGAQYAWESGFTGREDTPQGLVYRNERHINGDVALAQWQYYLATDDIQWLKTRGYPVLKATADWWVSKAKYVPDKKRYEILQVVPPDENAELVNNSAYTNAIAKLNLEIALQAAKLTGNSPGAKWADVASKMYIPYDAVNMRFIAHDDHQPTDVAKQADTELLAYPLQVALSNTDMTPIYRNTLAYYGPKVHKNGPAMISSAFSVIAARTGDRDRAYKEFVKSYKPYFREPFMLFNEKASLTFDNTCFLTGAAGPIQAALFGLAGARMEYFPSDYASTDLRFMPCLPKAWKSMKITGVHWRGKVVDITVTQGDKVTVAPRRP